MLAQRLARRGWRIVVLEAGPFWHPDQRLGLRRGRQPPAVLDPGADDRRRRPDRAGQEQLRPRRRRLDGPLRRLHAAVPPLRLPHPHRRRRRRRLADRLRRPAAALRAGRARAAGRRPGLAVGRPAPLPARRRTRSPAAAAKLREGGAARAGSRCGSARSAIVNGTFGNRPHCIYRGYCLQGCKVNAKASPLRHPPARRARARRRGPRRQHGPAGRDRRRHRAAARGVVYTRDGDGDAPAARRARSPSPATPSRPRGCCWPPPAARHPHGLGNDARPGRPLRDGPGRHPDPPGACPRSCACTRRRRRRSPPSSSTRPTPRAGSPAGSRSRPSSPLPIGWAEHVLADGHWGRALREYMRDYNHWATHRRAQRAAAARRQPGHARRRDRPATASRSPAWTTR